MNDNEREKLKIREYNVRKANELIQRTRYNLSMQEQKIILYIISKIKPNDDISKIYNFRIVDFCKIAGIDYENGKNYANLKAALKNLCDKSMWIKLDNGKETLLRWIKEPFLEPKSGTIEIILDEKMRPYLLDVQKNFTQYRLYEILAMRSQYSIRLYELLKSYETIGRWKFNVDELKQKLFAEKYNRFPDFKRRVVEKAVEEINDYTDLKIRYTLEKYGKKYTEITFFIKQKTNLAERVASWDKINQILGK